MMHGLSLGKKLVYLEDAVISSLCVLHKTIIA
jgi:hypothetical protein